MDATIKRLRENGRRKPVETVTADRGTPGTLSLSAYRGAGELRLAGASDEGLPAVLHDARLIGLHADMLLFSGIEYGPDGTGHAQEWSVRLRLARWQGELFVAESGGRAGLDAAKAAPESEKPR